MRDTIVSSACYFPREDSEVVLDNRLIAGKTFGPNTVLIGAELMMQRSENEIEVPAFERAVHPLHYRIVGEDLCLYAEAHFHPELFPVRRRVGDHFTIAGQVGLSHARAPGPERGVIHGNMAGEGDKVDTDALRGVDVFSWLALGMAAEGCVHMTIRSHCCLSYPDVCYRCKRRVSANRRDWVDCDRGLIRVRSSILSAETAVAEPIVTILRRIFIEFGSIVRTAGRNLTREGRNCDKRELRLGSDRAMRTKISSTGFLLVVALLMVSPVFSQETDTDSADDEQANDEEQDQVEPVSEEEIDHFAGVQLAVRRGQQELEEEVDEIRSDSGLTSTEFRQLQRSVDEAGGDLEEVDESLLEDDRYEETITALADVRERGNEIVSDAVSESPIDESRFDELAILISNDRELMGEVNEIVSAELEEEREEEQAEAEAESEAEQEEDDQEAEEGADEEENDS